VIKRLDVKRLRAPKISEFDPDGVQHGVGVGGVGAVRRRGAEQMVRRQ
jgi:hypothetical protein